MMGYNYHIWIIVKMLKWKFPLLFRRSLDKMKNKLPSGPLSALSISLPKIYISVRREKGHNKEVM